eukprot:scaffold213455_cov19-Tisochrysis_lutea.AAC.1
MVKCQKLELSCFYRQHRTRGPGLIAYLVATFHPSWVTLCPMHSQMQEMNCSSQAVLQLSIAFLAKAQLSPIAQPEELEVSSRTRTA